MCSCLCRNWPCYSITSIEEHKGDVTRGDFYRRFLIHVTRVNFEYNFVAATVCYTRRFLTQHCKFVQHVAVTKCYVKVMLHGTTRNNNFPRNVCCAYISFFLLFTKISTFLISTLRLNFLFRGAHSFVHKPDSRSFTIVEMKAVSLKG